MADNLVYNDGRFPDGTIMETRQQADASHRQTVAAGLLQISYRIPTAVPGGAGASYAIGDQVGDPDISGIGVPTLMAVDTVTVYDPETLLSPTLFTIMIARGLSGVAAIPGDNEALTDVSTWQPELSHIIAPGGYETTVMPGSPAGQVMAKPYGGRIVRWYGSSNVLLVTGAAIAAGYAGTDGPTIVISGQAVS